MLIKWSYRFPHLCWLLRLEWLSYFDTRSPISFEHMMSFQYLFLEPHQNHIPLKYRCLDKKCNQRRVVDSISETCCVLEVITWSWDQCLQRFLGITSRDPNCFPSPTGYMLTSLSFSLLIWGVFYNFPLKWQVIFLNSGTSTHYFSNSTSSWHGNFVQV